jgi:hypothetical protein
MSRNLNSKKPFYQARAEEEVKKKVTIEKSSPARGFAVFNDDSDSERDEVKVSIKPNIVVEKFPALGAPTKSQMAVTKTGYADAVSNLKPMPANVEEDRFLAQLEERTMNKNLPQSAMIPAPVVKIPSIKTVERNMAKEIYTKNWVEWTDNDSDEEDWQPSAFVKDTMPNAFKYSVPQPSSYGLGVNDDDW